MKAIAYFTLADGLIATEHNKIRHFIKPPQTIMLRIILKNNKQICFQESVYDVFNSIYFPIVLLNLSGGIYIPKMAVPIVT